MSLKSARLAASTISEGLLNGSPLRGISLEQLAERWIVESVRRKSPGSEYTSRLRMSYLPPALLKKTCSSIARRDLVEALKKIQKTRSYKTALRTAAIVGAAFNFAMDEGLLDRSPASELSRALIPDSPQDKEQKHFDAVPEPDELGKLLCAMETIPVQSTRLALFFMAYTFVRHGEMRLACWKEIDFEKALWFIPAEHTKRRREQVVPLARQAMKILEEQKAQTNVSGDALIFSSNIRGREMPKTRMLNALKNLRLKLDAPLTTVHGFRATASTLLNGAGFPADVIERQLAHVEKNKVRSAYNRFEYLEARTEMMQWYADYLDALRDKTPIPEMPQRF